MDEKLYNGSSKYAAELKAKDAEAYKKQYGAYIKAGIAPESMEQLFRAAKEKILKA